jgi:hypothetical protein
MMKETMGLTCWEQWRLHFMAWDHHVVSWQFVMVKVTDSLTPLWANSDKGYNFIHCNVLLSWTSIATTHFLCCFQSFVEICLQSCCMWGHLHCSLVEISWQSCICQGVYTASLAMYELIIKCVGEKDPVCLFSAFFGNVFRMGGDLLSPWWGLKKSC